MISFKARIGLEGALRCQDKSYVSRKMGEKGRIDLAGKSNYDGLNMNVSAND